MTQTLPIIPDPELRRLPEPEDRCFGSLSTARGHLPLEAMDVRARIDGLVASVELRQTFVNTIDEPIEATYIFPLPDRAAVTRFRMVVGGRVIEGAIKERGEARQIYDDAINAGHRAAITEEERPGVFTMRVGNLVPGDRAEVTLSMTGPLPIEDGDVTFRFPLVVAPRYVPGTPLGGDDVGAGTAHDTDAVPDASRITPPVLLPGYPNPVRLALAVDIDAAGLPLSNLRSSLHAVTETGDGSRRTVALRPGERLDRDFILRFSLGDDAIRTGLVLAPDADGDEGTFMLTVVPPRSEADADKPRDVVFVLDRSGSMGGWKMIAARRAVARMVDSLTDRDRFSVMAFDNSIDEPPRLTAGSLSDATDRNRFRAVEFLAGLEARGGTEMRQPLERAAELLAGGYQDRDKILVLATDGQVGNEDQILRALGVRLKNVRTFALGIDRAVNAAFLRRLAVLGGGAFELVESEDRLDEVMDRIHRRIATPVVTELALEPAGIGWIPDSLVPQRKPDLFAGAPVTIYGRYRGEQSGAIAVAGRDPAGEAWQATVPGETSDNPAIGKLWARAALRDLEDRYVLGRGGRSELERRIVEISLRFSVLCRFTAFVAVDEAEKVNPGGGLTEIVQPVEMPDGWAQPGFAPAPQMTMAGAAPPEMMKTMASLPMGAPPPAPSSPARSGGALGRARKKVAGLFGRGQRERSSMDADAFAPMEMAEEALADDGTVRDGYRDRLRAIADRLAAKADERSIKRAIGDLTALAEDASSVGDGELAGAIRDLVTDARGRLSGDLTALAADLVSAIRDLVKGGGRGRGAFWK